MNPVSLHDFVRGLPKAELPLHIEGSLEPEMMFALARQIPQADGKPVPLSYVLAKQNGDWRIVDVLMDKSISELAVRRSEFQPVLGSGGPDKLVEVLDAKTNQLRAEGRQ